VTVAAFSAYVASIYMANWLLLNVGTEHPGGIHTIPVGPGLDAPSGVLAIGAALTLRDVVQRRCGTRIAVCAVALGALLTGLLSVNLAFASGFTFLLAEGADLIVFTVLRARFVLAVAVSNIVGAWLDTWVFLSLAFGTAEAWRLGLPSLVGKVEFSLATFIAIAVASRLWSRYVTRHERQSSDGRAPREENQRLPTSDRAVDGAEGQHQASGH
jgi:uncharacterized PurR-regulated membrane protein YhhQ (DUF165 family)